MGYKGHKGGMGWPGGVDFPQWAIDIIQFRNKKLNDDYIKSNYKFDDVEKEYEEIDGALLEFTKFVTLYYKKQ